MTTKLRPDAGKPFNPNGNAQNMSFVRSRKQQRIVLLEATPQPVELDLAATALVVVDMQRLFASRGLVCGSRCRFRTGYGRRAGG